MKLREKSGNKKKASFKPGLEALEARWCPALVNFIWEPQNESNAWSDESNWYNCDEKAFDYGIPDATNKCAIFSGSSGARNKDIMVSSNYTIGAIWTQDGYSSQIYVDGSVLTISADGADSFGLRDSTILDLSDAASVVKFEAQWGKSANGFLGGTMTIANGDGGASGKLIVADGASLHLDNRVGGGFGVVVDALIQVGDGDELDKRPADLWFSSTMDGLMSLGDTGKVYIEGEVYEGQLINHFKIDANNAAGAKLIAHADSPGVHNDGLVLVDIGANEFRFNAPLVNGPASGDATTHLKSGILNFQYVGSSNFNGKFTQLGGHFLHQEGDGNQVWFDRDAVFAGGHLKTLNSFFNGDTNGDIATWVGGNGADLYLCGDTAVILAFNRAAEPEDIGQDPSVFLLVGDGSKLYIGDTPGGYGTGCNVFLSTIDGVNNSVKADKIVCQDDISINDSDSSITVTPLHNPTKDEDIFEDEALLVHSNEGEILGNFDQEVLPTFWYSDQDGDDFWIYNLSV